METPEDTAARTEIVSRKCHGAYEGPDEAKRGWETFFAAIEGRRAKGRIDDFIAEEAA